MLGKGALCVLRICPDTGSDATKLNLERFSLDLWRM